MLEIFHLTQLNNFGSKQELRTKISAKCGFKIGVTLLNTAKPSHPCLLAAVCFRKLPAIKLLAPAKRIFPDFLS